MARGPHAPDRLRRARARDAGRDRGERAATMSRSPAFRPCCTTGPERIPEAVRAKIREHRAEYARILVLYADCGTGGELDRVLAEEGVERIGGPHCYAFYAGPEGLRRAGRCRAGHVLPHRLPDPAVRHAGDRGARPGPASRAAADVFRQLPAPGLSRPDRGRRARRPAPRPRPSGWAWPTSTASPGSASSPSSSAPPEGIPMAEKVVVYWRDIPAQVIVKAGRKTAKRQLSERFEQAIDRAAMRAQADRHGCLSRAVAAGRPGRRAATIWRPRRQPRPRRWRRSTRPSACASWSPTAAPRDG